jgi:hypothetical protein
MRIDLIQNLQERLGVAMKKTLTGPQRNKLKATMSHCEILNSDVNFRLVVDDYDDEETTKRYSGWSKLIQKFMKHVHGGSTM